MAMCFNNVQIQGRAVILGHPSSDENKEIYQERCFRDYVKSIREEYDIKKHETSRQYEAMDEQPPGRQSQSMGNLKKQYSYILDLREALRK